ncbi:hypothetical protein ACH61_01375 [Rathayibacter tanaceti]|uniref:Uncharacterized protein n=1 Tax=Rathayibacter tanaceti TaxID=1671680 RepID=A0A166I2I1_9MICO|nr:hypothetical protein ACH61_01375 [Rathayibacter tanaceti]
MPGDSGDPLAASAVEHGREAHEAGRDDQRLGDGRVADGVRVRLGAVHGEVDADRFRVRGDLLGDRRDLEPGREESGGLGALTWGDDDDHGIQSSDLRSRVRRVEPLTKNKELVAGLQVRVVTGQLRAGLRRTAPSGSLIEPRMRADWRMSASRAPVASQPMTSATRLSR